MVVGVSVPAGTLTPTTIHRPCPESLKVILKKKECLMKKTGGEKCTHTVILILCVLLFAGCGGSSSASSVQTPASTQPSVASTEQPVPTISSSQASGSDIPDTQV